MYLGIPRRTLYHWISDNPLWSPPGTEANNRLLSFNDLAQAHFIEFIRKHAAISVRKAREILHNAQLETDSQYPLLDKNIKVLFRHILLDKPARGYKARHIVDLSQHRQFVMQHVVDLFATRIRRGKKGELEQIYPWRLYVQGNQDRPVTIDPQVMSGRLVITGTRIPVKVVWSRKESGEKIPALAQDYGITEQIIEQALRHVGLPKAA